MSQIPEEKKAKIISQILESANGSWKDLAEEGFDSGYALSLELLEQKDAEIKRLKELLKETYTDYLQKKYLLVDIRLSHTQYPPMWEKFKAENNL